MTAIPLAARKAHDFVMFTVGAIVAVSESYLLKVFTAGFFVLEEGLESGK